MTAIFNCLESSSRNKFLFGLKKPTSNNKNILTILKILIFKAKIIIKPKINDVPETPIKGKYPVKLRGT